MSAGLRNESASAKRGARSGAGQRSTSSLSHARPDCAGADKRKLRNVESQDGLDKDLEMPKEPNGVLISSAGQPGERGDGDPHSTVRRPRVDRPKINGETAGGARHAAVGTGTRDREGHRKMVGHVGGNALVGARSHKASGISRDERKTVTMSSRSSRTR
jgi:hypothetical protein